LSYTPTATKCFGVSISYLIIIKKLMPNVVLSLYHDLTSPTTNPPAWALSEHIWLFIFLAILAPLAFLREIHSLRHTSYIALFTVGMCLIIASALQSTYLPKAYLVLIVITCYFWPLAGMPPPGEVKLVHFTPNFVSTFPVQVFAFTCAQNVSLFDAGKFC
jgi:amino acid permease